MAEHDLIRENAPGARETLCPGLASPALDIRIPNRSTCTTVPGQFKKRTFPTQNVKIEMTHLEKGALNIPFCGRQDADITHHPQSLFFLTQGTQVALTHTPGEQAPATSSLLLFCPTPDCRTGVQKRICCYVLESSEGKFGGQVLAFEFGPERTLVTG